MKRDNWQTVMPDWFSDRDDEDYTIAGKPGCYNCGWPTTSHCKRHVIPCCPGRCLSRPSDERVPESEEPR